MPEASHSAENLLRSSAESIIVGDVPATLMPRSLRSSASVLGIWPPTETIVCSQPSVS